MEIIKKILQTWYNPMKEYIDDESNYYTKLMQFLNLSYKQKFIYPNQQNAFKVFQKTKFEDLLVVILGDEPYSTKYKSTGLAFANEDSIQESSFSPVLLTIKDCIEETVLDGMYIDFDPTLESWAEQGVMMLNTSLTVEANKPGSHEKYWKKFTTDLLTSINNNKTSIIFCFWGKEAQEYSHLIDDKFHYVLKAEHPVDSIAKGEKWNCNHFKEINKILLDNNGEDFGIKW